VCFVVLKLTGYISWSWWWVTAPFWGGLVLFLGIMLFTALAVGITGLGIILYEKLTK
jgi:hypothetical protein